MASFLAMTVLRHAGLLVITPTMANYGLLIFAFFRLLKNQLLDFQALTITKMLVLLRSERYRERFFRLNHRSAVRRSTPPPVASTGLIWTQ
jgi:hypothetical protein